MTHFDRRTWLKTAGWAGAVALMGGATTSIQSRTSIMPDILPKTGPAMLNFNENPYGPSQAVRDAIVQHFNLGCRYPDDQELVNAIAQKEGVLPENVVVTAGSREGLCAAGLLFGTEGGDIVAADPTFNLLMEYARQWGAYIHRVPLRPDDLQHDLEAMDRRISNQTKLVFVCNPNNPTGSLLPAAQLRDFVAATAKKTVVFCDEAYFDYIQTPNYPSMIELVKQDHNVIVSRTFSKVYGMAGIRLGYLIARPEMAARLSYQQMAAAGTVAIQAGLAALKDDTFYRFSLEQNEKCRQIIYKSLDALGRRYVPSNTNFVFFHTGRPIDGFIKDMKKEGIIVGRPFPPLTDWCRISTGLVEDVERFAQALPKVLG